MLDQTTILKLSGQNKVNLIILMSYILDSKYSCTLYIEDSSTLIIRIFVEKALQNRI